MRIHLRCLILTISFLSSFLLTSVPIYGQEVISSIGIDGRVYQNVSDITVRDPQGNYYVSLEYDTKIEGIFVGDEFLPANRIDDTPTAIAVEDAYILKFDAEHNFLAYSVIDNSPSITDFSSSGNYNVLSLNHYFEFPSYPITVQDSIIITPAGPYGDLILFDENLQLIRNIQPTTGRIENIVIDSHFIYLGCIIPRHMNFILIEEDTIYKQKASTGEFLETETIVLCKYDIEGDSVIWHLRIGGSGDEQLFGMYFDLSRNLVIRGETDSRNFSFNDMDTLVSFTENNPFLAKYSEDGELLFGIINLFPTTSTFNDHSFDTTGNVYIVGSYSGPSYYIDDTILNNTFINGTYTTRPFLVKYDAIGKFQWIRQLEGEFRRGSFNSIAFPVIDRIILVGSYSDGQIIIGANEYYDTSYVYNSFMIQLNVGTGEYMSHYFTQGENQRHLLDTYQDDNQSLSLLLRIYGESNIFNHQFYPVGSDEYAFYLVKLSTDFTSSITPNTQGKEEIWVYPNPAAGNACYLNSNLFEGGEKVEYQISELSGRTLFKGHFYSEIGSVKIELPHSITGICCLTLQFSNKKYSQFVFIE